MKCIIAGGRDFVGHEEHLVWLMNLSCCMAITEIVSGGATGADAYGEEFARIMAYPLAKFPADWNKHGRAAGPIRNRQMAEYADALILFPGGKGAADMKSAMKKLGKPIYEYAKEGQ